MWKGVARVAGVSLNSRGVILWEESENAIELS
jgi:hypothetical protein